MADKQRSWAFDTLDERPTGPATQMRPPSATADALRSNVQAARSAPQTRVREPNTMPNIFDLPNPYPTSNAPQAPTRTGPSVHYLTPDGRSPDDPLKASQRNTAELFSRARSTKDLAERSALLREAMASADFDRAALGSRTDLDLGSQRIRSATDLANLQARTDTGIAGQRERTALKLGELSSLDTRYGVDTRDARSAANAELQASTSRANTLDSILARAEESAADMSLRREAMNLGNTGSYTYADHAKAAQNDVFLNNPREEQRSLEAALAGTNNPAEQRLIKERILELDNIIGGGAPGMYRGGLVPGYAAGGIVEGGAGPALASATPTMPDPALIARYTQYAEGAQALGLTAVGFDEFARMAQGAAATAGTAPPPSGAGAPVALAGGGQVPDASGKMVIDSDPNAPTDSIPAVIDGQTPAALDSGELVFPRHAVLYYGTDKLNKMIAKSAEAAEGGNGKSATGLNG